MLSFFLALRSCLSSRVAVLSSLLLSGVRNQCQALEFFFSIFCFIWIGHCRVVSPRAPRPILWESEWELPHKLLNTSVKNFHVSYIRREK
jgi:hypothetical protein